MLQITYIMKNIFKTSILIIAAATWSCSSQKSESPEQILAQEPRWPAILDEAFAAHGGIEKWQSFETLEYDVPKEDGPEHHVIDLKNRKVLISSNEFKIGYDGNEVWVTPDSAAFGGNARFYHNLYFYFFSLPYLAADPGINYDDQGTVAVNGTEYQKVLMTFEANTGDAPEDKYVLYFNDKNILEIINYSVTYYDKSRADRFNAIRYEDWKPVNGLLLPGKLVGYVWQGDSLADKRYERTFENAVLSTQKKSAPFFSIPENAYISPKPE